MPGARYIDERAYTIDEETGECSYPISGDLYSVIGNGDENGSDIENFDYSPFGAAGGGGGTTCGTTDVNCDRIVDAADLQLINRALDSSPGDPNWNPRVDIDGNGLVELDPDLRFVRDALGTTGGSGGGYTPENQSFALHGRPVDVLSDGHVLQYNRARYYNPRHGRWLQRDPKGYVNSGTLYEGFASNPLRYPDPLGKDVIENIIELGYDELAARSWEDLLDTLYNLDWQIAPWAYGGEYQHNPDRELMEELRKRVIVGIMRKWDQACPDDVELGRMILHMEGDTPREILAKGNRGATTQAMYFYHKMLKERGKIDTERVDLVLRELLKQYVNFTLAVASGPMFRAAGAVLFVGPEAEAALLAIREADAAIAAASRTAGLVDDAANGGRRLIVGGGRPPRFLKGQANDVSVNLDAAAAPHVVGDINLAPFRTGSFNEVVFERVQYQSFTGNNAGALQEAARMLRPGGRLNIITGAAAPVDEITLALRAAGFNKIVPQSGDILRITATLGPLP